MKNLVQCASVPAYLTEETAREIDSLVKTLPQECQYIRKAIPVEMQFEPGAREEVSIISTDAVDRDAEVILPDGIQMDQYRKNPIVLWSHDHDRPIAKCNWIKLFKGQIRAKTNYDVPESVPDGAWKQFVEDIWAMTVAGVLRAKSVGLLPLTPKRGPTPEELAAHPDWENIAIRDATILLEYSCCSTGINQDALVEAINTKSIQSANVEALGITLPPIPKKMPTKQDIIAAVMPYMMQPIAKKKYPPKPRINVEAMIERAISEIDIADVVRKAEELYRSRGRV